MADLALDTDALRRDRARYAALLTQAEGQIAAWNERADHVQQAIDGLDKLLAFAGVDPGLDGGVARAALPSRGVARPAATRPAAATASPPAASERTNRSSGKPKKATEPARTAASTTATPAPSATVTPPEPGAASVTPATPKPSTPKPATKPATSKAATPKPGPKPSPHVDDVVAADAPKGTDAVRLVLESRPDHPFALADLVAELRSRSWLVPSRRPEELVRINLKRLAERGGAVRTDDGRWRAADGAAPANAPATAPEPAADPPVPVIPPAPPRPEPVRPEPPRPIIGTSIQEW